MITDAALQSAARSQSCTSRDVGTGQQATATLRPKQVLYMQNEPSVPP